ncbi:hypothetical protein A7X61_09300 [Stenotrophomonas maltophilia]|nr:hypothetical protein A7X61_09300 [Stenotrophomonas maltophilia]
MGDLELERPAGLLLHDQGARRYLSIVGDVRHPQLYQVASAEPGIYREIEQREITAPVTRLELDADGPDVFQIEWHLLVDQLSFVPRLVRLRWVKDCHD